MQIPVLPVVPAFSKGALIASFLQGLLRKMNILYTRSFVWADLEVKTQQSSKPEIWLGPGLLRISMSI